MTAVAGGPAGRVKGWVLVAGQIALLAALVVLPTGDAWTVGPVLRGLGTAGRVVGALAIVLGVGRLGTGAAVHPAPTTGATLRTTGPYRLVRHPIYAGVLLLAAAIAATSGTILHLCVFFALAALLTAKSAYEERLVAERFPDYAAYATRTRRFLPVPKRSGGRRIDGPADLRTAEEPRRCVSIGPRKASSPQGRRAQSS